MNIKGRGFSLLLLLLIIAGLTAVGAVGLVTLKNPSFLDTESKENEAEAIFTQDEPKQEADSQPATKNVVEEKQEATVAKVAATNSTAQAALVLESSVFVTPNGVKVMRQPKGWTANVIKDEPPMAYVHFANPEKTITIQVGVAMPVESVSSEAQGQTDRMIGIYAYGGNGEVVKNVPIEIGGAKGIDLEIQRAESVGGHHIRHVVVTTPNPDQYYLFTIGMPGTEWPKYKDIVEAAVRTLHI